MAYLFNPFTSTFDISSIASDRWREPVSTFSSLPGSGNTIGDAIAVEDTGAIYVWNGSAWINSSGISGIGSAVVSGTNKSVLFVDSSVNLAQDNTNFNYDQSTKILTVSGQVTTPVVDRSSSGTLAIGTSSNSTTINIGNSGATVNIQGTTLYENVTQLQVKDPLITLNKGGGAGSASNSGIELEENSVITGYAESSADRNSWILKAPNTAGIATITPGSGGITLDQSSHNAVTLGAVGSSPNANAASLSTQVLTLQPADGTNPGVITSGTQTIGGAKTFSSTISASNFSGTSSGTNTGDQTITLTGAVTGTGTGSFATTYAGTVPINKGGTNSTTALNNNRIIQSSSGAIIEASAITASRALISDTNGIPTHSTVTSTELGYVSGVTSAIQTQINNKLNLSGGTMSGAIDMGSHKITSVTDPTSNQDAATKKYVDDVAAGINPAVAVQAATTSSSNTSGFTYLNGVSGIGATFTGSVNTAITIDGYTFTALGQRLLIKNDTQSPSGAFNGVYYVTQVQTGILAPILTRALDYDQSSDINNTGAIPVINGTVNGTTQWVLTSLVNTVGTDPLTYVKFSRNPSDYILASSGDINETSFSAANNQSSAANVTGFAFANGTVRAFQAIISIYINATSSLYAIYDLKAVQKGAAWEMSQNYTGDITGIVFTITTAGQIQYTSTNVSGFVSNTMKFRAFTVSI